MHGHKPQEDNTKRANATSQTQATQQPTNQLGQQGANLLPQQILQLQRSIGNTATRRLIQRTQPTPSATSSKTDTITNFTNDAVIQGVLGVQTIHEQDAYNCGLFSIWMAIEALAGKSLPEMRKKLGDKAQELTGDLGGLFTFAELEKVVSAVGHTASRVNFNGQADFVEKLKGTGGSPVLIAYDCLVADPNNGQLAGGNPGDRAHWSVISHFNEGKQFITVSNPWGSKQYYKVTDIFGANNDLKGESFNWKDFATSAEGTHVEKAFFDKKARDYGQEPEKIKDRLPQNLDLGGYIVTIS